MKFNLFTFRKSIGRNEPSRRKYVRKNWMHEADWDFFTGSTGVKPCLVENLSPGGCLLRSPEPIQNRRWVRVVLKDDGSGVSRAVIGWVVRLEDNLTGTSTDPAHDRLSYRYGVEFLHSAARTLALE